MMRDWSAGTLLVGSGYSSSVLSCILSNHSWLCGSRSSNELRGLLARRHEVSGFRELFWLSVKDDLFRCFRTGFVVCLIGGLVGGTVFGVPGVVFGCVTGFMLGFCFGLFGGNSE